MALRGRSACARMFQGMETVVSNRQALLMEPVVNNQPAVQCLEVPIKVSGALLRSRQVEPWEQVARR
jgi:hypothetical protein